MIDLRLDTVSYDKVVLRGFELNAAAGETVILTGASGAGKSTLLRVIAGLHKKFTGSRKVSGAVSLMPQGECLLPWYTVGQNLNLLGRAEPALFDSLGLSDMKDRLPSQLSGGQARRAALGQALAAKPDILLLDEPFSALDADTKTEIIALFSDLRRREKFTCVLVTHDDREAAAVGGRVIKL